MVPVCFPAMLQCWTEATSGHIYFPSPYLLLVHLAWKATACLLWKAPSVLWYHLMQVLISCCNRAGASIKQNSSLDHSRKLHTYKYPGLFVTQISEATSEREGERQEGCQGQDLCWAVMQGRGKIHSATSGGFLSELLWKQSSILK